MASAGYVLLKKKKGEIIRQTESGERSVSMRPPGEHRRQDRFGCDVKTARLDVHRFAVRALDSDFAPGFSPLDPVERFSCHDNAVRGDVLAVVDVQVRGEACLGRKVGQGLSG